ncbi:S1 family peptidase [Paenibacillus daejeonensis]|uniref:S1 family peptidase n=1 Tax=Paenibacillus daejeonensis TaxID=135193 RepID=UPI00036C2678|nr:serine protease [Paenibacillus daejeonensis]
MKDEDSNEKSKDEKATGEPEHDDRPRERSGKVVQMHRNGQKERPSSASTSPKSESSGDEKPGGKVVQMRPRTVEASEGQKDEEAPEDPLDPNSDAFWEEDDEEELTEAQEKRRKRIKSFVLSLLALALVGNIIAFWPQIYNRETLPFLFTSRELSRDEQIQQYKESIALVSTDRGRGTGFYIPEGYIVTNHHVVKDRVYQQVQFPTKSQSTYPATVVASDPSVDLAILRIDGDHPDDWPSLPLDEGGWTPDMPVHVVGNPRGFTLIVGQGTVIGEMQLRDWQHPVLALDAPIFEGNSGSPVINEEGRVSAVVFATTERVVEDQTKKIGLAVPVERVHRLLAQLPN